MNEKSLQQLEKENNHLKDIISQIAEFVCDEHASYGELEDWMTEMGILKKQIRTIYEVNEEWGKP